MPYIKTTTNGPLPQGLCETLKTGLGKAVGALGKSESYLMVDFCENAPLYFQGNDEPAALISVDLFGASGEEAYRAFTAEATRLVAEATGIPANRIFVKYAESRTWGWNGSNL